MPADLDLSELDVLIAKYDDPRGPDHVQLDRMVTSELLPIWPALRERLAAAEAERAELLEWRRRALEEVRADMRADRDLASALAEAQAELERLRRVKLEAESLVAWDWLDLLKDCHDANDVRRDVQRLEAALYGEETT